MFPEFHGQFSLQRSSVPSKFLLIAPGQGKIGELDLSLFTRKDLNLRYVYWNCLDLGTDRRRTRRFARHRRRNCPCPRSGLSVELRPAPGPGHFFADSVAARWPWRL